MFFIPLDKSDNFFKDIKTKYNHKSFDKFYKYLYRFLFTEYIIKKYLWNYNNYINDNNITEYKYFVTNNFLERSNRTLNENMIYKKSSISNFRNIILNTDYYFENKSEYDINNPSLSKAIIYYIKNITYLDKKTKKVKLIDFKQLKEIDETYTEVVRNSGLEMFDGIINYDFILERNDNYEDDESSTSSKKEESSEDSEKEVNNPINEKDNNDDNDKDNNGKGNGDIGGLDNS